MSRSKSIYIGMGSNLGDRAGNLFLGLRGILEAGLVPKRVSAIYETEPVADIVQPSFLNSVVELDGETILNPEQVMARLLRIEYALGRTRDVPKGPRTIDLDLLLYKNEKSDTEFLTLPHPRLHQRRFVLVPFAEIAPEVVHPTLKKTISQLLKEVYDMSAVRRWQP